MKSLQAGSQGTGTARNEVGSCSSWFPGWSDCEQEIARTGGYKFSRGWVELARDGLAAAESANAATVRRNRRGHGDADHRAARAEKLSVS